MIKKILYSCKFCGTDYSNEEKANLCEKNHKTLQKAEYEEVYRSQNSVPDGWPTKIRVKVRNGDYIVYRR